MKKLELKFVNELGKIVTYSIDSPEEPVDPSKVHAAMDEIIAQNAFNTGGGNLVAKKSARIVERTVEDVDLGLE
ncbi:DUF2922 domain-containing protein [Ornithinibacillus halophilus]|uniref:DUF2922 domain-containing protein n=1 Tax=Ornithinibacillus halophilus TaxID=930117 RepID=A0A1M5E828_9BACI|nr:DUF2922 domain-containing protein [Ornithinibacillus halophilus]SHF75399.1 Protein of unknown function [Ornithinibacillus halophilus]